jgi:hypothetical protein
MAVAVPAAGETGFREKGAAPLRRGKHWVILFYMLKSRTTRLY